MHNKNSFTRKDVSDVQDYLSELINEIGHVFVNQIISICSAPFNIISTEYKLFKYLEEYDLLVRPLEFTINNEIAEILHNGESVFGERRSRGIILPLDFQFRKKISQNNMLKNTLDAIRLLKSKLIT